MTEPITQEFIVRQGPLFLQVGCRGINMDRVRYIVFGKDSIGTEKATLFMDGDERIWLNGDETECFMDWWNNKANVYNA